MSSTRKSTTGEFHQERFCSSPEFEGDSINGLAAAKRIAIVKDRIVREVLWFIQWRSLMPNGVQQLCDELISSFPDRIGTPTLRKVLARKAQRPTSAELKFVHKECGWQTVEDWDGAVVSPQREVADLMKRARDSAADLVTHLKQCCLNPGTDLSTGVWYFSDLFGALKSLRCRFIEAAWARLAATVITTRINETLDFWFAEGLVTILKRPESGPMILIEGCAGIGRTATLRAWCDAHAGLVRYVEVPSSSDDRSFFASMARSLGVARGASFKAQQIKVRVEEMLATSELMLAFDESQYLWTQIERPRRTPDRLLWIKTALDAGTPVALIALDDFSKWRARYVERTLWSDEQFERRLNRTIVLPGEHSKEDMLKIARLHFPSGDVRSWKLLAAYALGTEKKQASGIVEALRSAHYRATQAGREVVSFADIEAALIHDHAFFINAAPALGVQPRRKPAAKPAHSRFRGRHFGSRITTPVAVET